MTEAVTVQYIPADGWLAVARDGHVVLAPEAALAAHVDEARRILAEPDPVGPLLELLMADGLAAMPSFGYAELAAGAARVLVRGAVSVRLDSGEIRGSDYSTWGEHRETGVEGVALAVDSVSGEAPALPLADGAARAGTVLLGAIDEAGPSETPIRRPEQAPRPTADPVSPAAPEPAVARQQTPEPVSPEPAVTPAPEAVPVQTIAEFTMTEADPGYGHLFEETIVRPIEHAAVRENEPEGAAEPETAPVDEHDGLTIVSGELKKLREATAPPATAPAAPPAVAELHFSTGLSEPLTGPVIIGRSPSSGKVSAGRVPRLITIPDDPDISRSHLQIEPEGDTVVVTDLHSRNGTSVVLPGRSPERLRGGVPSTVIDGTVIDLGGGLTIQVRQNGAGGL